MAEATFHFPKDFSWGTATSSHQVEGQNTNNNWYAWERKGHIVDDHTCGLACDWWNGRWKEDFDRAAESGQNAHRLSIEWSRVQPTPDRWDEDALDYYRQMVRGLVERGLKPMVTLHHFTDPYWLTEIGAWENSTIITDFETYTRKVVEALKEYVSLWCTINEPNVYTTMGYIMGVFPPGDEDLSTAFRVMANMLKGHATAYHAIHDVQPEARVGMAVNYRGMNPARDWFPPDRWVANLISRLYNDFFPQAATDGVMRFLFNRKSVPAAKGTQDFLGINYYTRELVAFNPFAPNDLFSKRYFDPESELSETGFIANKPEGFFEALRWGLQYNKPIIVTENGVEDSEDSFRRRYLIEHIHKLWQGVNRSWPIEGYYYWSLVDNFEWERGWTQRFGMWELDVETQARRKRSSVDLYAAICKQNALSSEMVADFAPELSEKIFPG